MTIKDICGLPVMSIAHDDCALFLWDVRENGDLTENWWVTLPKAMQDTIDQMLEARRKVKK